MRGEVEEFALPRVGDFPGSAWLSWPGAIQTSGKEPIRNRGLVEGGRKIIWLAGILPWSERRGQGPRGAIREVARCPGRTREGRFDLAERQGEPCGIHKSGCSKLGRHIDAPA
jgi:hypothetical protein